nr:alpha-1,2-fucosyltransferase [Lachnospiraceae bacterium]
DSPGADIAKELVPKSLTLDKLRAYQDRISFPLSVAGKSFPSLTSYILSQPAIVLSLWAMMIMVFLPWKPFIAEEKGVPFCTAGRKNFANNIHSSRGMYFMDVDLGIEVDDDQVRKMARFEDADERLFTGNSPHDLTHGCYVSGVKPSIHDVEDNTLLYGNLQAQNYFAAYTDRLKDWLKVLPEADTHEYTADDLCIINLRGGEYTDDPALFLDRNYFVMAMQRMRKIREDMRFMVVTEDEEAARKVLPEIERHHFDMGKDYAVIKNARYLIVSNSSFAVMPAFTSGELRYAIAPKYWARYNVSDGYWASAQNIYDIFDYMDRKGRISSAEECRLELEAYISRSRLWDRTGKRPEGIGLSMQKLRCSAIRTGFTVRKAWRKIERETGLIHGQ